MPTTHFDEIDNELKELGKREDLLRITVIVLLWLPRLNQIIQDRYSGHQTKLGFLDAYNLRDFQVSIVNVATASHCIDFLFLASHLGIKTVIAFGLAGAFKMPVGTIFVADRALSEQKLTEHFTPLQEARYDVGLYRKLEQAISGLTGSRQVVNGTVVSLDLFSRETEEFLARYRGKADAVDMEVAPLYIMASLLGIRAIAVMIVSDVLGHSYFLRDRTEVSLVHAAYEKIVESLPRFAGGTT